MNHCQFLLPAALLVCALFANADAASPNVLIMQTDHSDPFELANQFHDPTQRGLIRDHARELKSYLDTSHDPLAQSKAITSDLAWALSDQAEYTAAERAPPRSRVKGKGKGKAKSADE